ncbi:MAG: OsmC family protein [Phycisphaerales bacterium JB043]
MSVTVSIGPTGFTSEVRTGDHAMLADEPVSLGGANKGATPFELLLASLGACTVMTLRMYADRKGWPLEGVRCSLEHARIPARDCETCESSEGIVTTISRTVDLHGSLSGDQRERLLEIAERCPVHRALTGEIHIRTTSGATGTEAHT